MKRLTLPFVTALAVLGCAPSNPVRPDLTTPFPSVDTERSTAWLWGMVFDGATDRCLDGAAIRVRDGSGQGRTTINEGPCGYWDYGGGFTLHDLTPGVAMTLRISAAGYATRDFTVTPSASQGQTMRPFVLTKE